MLYHNKKEWKEEDFRNPSSEYRGAPFWAWNCKVTREDVDSILNDLKEMGMGGAHIHSRTGMDIPYLSRDFMEMVGYSHETCSQLQMLTWLYDEDRFPSGAAGGLVTDNREYRQRFLVLSPIPLPAEDIWDFGADRQTDCKRSFIGMYDIHLENGCLSGYQFLRPETSLPESGDVWYLYREIAEDNAWFNHQAYVDTLNKKAVDKFVQVTYEAYYREFGNDFGKTIPAIFTDEPQFCHKSTLGYAGEKKSVILPFTDDFAGTFFKAYGCDFWECLPEFIWELPGEAVSAKRYYFHDHICERFVNAFADQIGGWCRNHGIALTGHMMEEPTLASQTAALGEAMRSYRSFDLPGIDMLYDGRELNTAKQAQSAVHQYGGSGMLSELYGVTNWDFDFRGHKLAGDWQAALGVTVRVHHLTWTSMAGEAKRDYPASIGYQSPWYKEYHLIEDYFARLNTALTRGRCEVKVGVIHPIESYWLFWGPREQTQGRRNEMEENFRKFTEWMLFGLIDFDFIAESLWKELTPDSELGEDGNFMVGKMKYDAIIVPGCVTIRRTTLERLQAFREKGGRIIFTGPAPAYVDAVRSEEAALFALVCEKIEFTGCKLLETLRPLRMVDIHNQHGVRTDNIISQVRADGEEKWLFLSHCRKMCNPDLPQREDLTIEITGEYRPVLYDAMTGKVREVPYEHIRGCTVLKETVYDHDSLLYYLKPSRPELSDQSIKCKYDCTYSGQQLEPGNTPKSEFTVKEKEIAIKLPDYVEVELEEPNVLILDMAESKLDDGPWQEREEILRIDNNFRRILGYPLRTEAFPQPWIAGVKPDGHRITLRFQIHSETEVESSMLAMEHADLVKITLNDQEVSSHVTGYFTDRSIQTITIPGLKKGINIITAKMPYYHGFNVEAMYLLGNFGVRIMGKNTIITNRNKSIAFGDICYQGMPFYGGNFQYKVPVTVDQQCSLKIETTQFRAPLLGICLDGEEKGKIAFSPYSLTIEGVGPGTHMLELTVYGSRINTFGALHNCNVTEPWQGHPDSYRTSGAAWSYEYRIRPAGILISPVITCIER